MATQLPDSKPAAPGDPLFEGVALVDTVFVAGPPVVLAWTGIVLFGLMLAGPFALLVAFALVLVAVLSLLALAGAIVVAPFLLVRHVRAHVRAHRAPRPARDTAPKLVPIGSQRVAA